MIRQCLMLMVVTAVSEHARAQDATVTLSHDDPDGIVVPGQKVRIHASLAFPNGAIFWEIRGDVRASPNVGVASNNVFPGQPPNPGGILNPGVVSGGSVLGFHLLSNELPGLGTPRPQWLTSPLSVLEYDWTAPAQPGDVAFNWVAPSTQSQALFLPFFGAINPVAFNTAYIGTTLTVVPAPTALGVIAVGGVAFGMRRRRC